MQQFHEQLRARLLADHREMNLLIERLDSTSADVSERRRLLQEFLVLSNRHRTDESRLNSTAETISELENIHEAILFFVDDLFCDSLQERVQRELVGHICALLCKHVEIETAR